MLCARNLSCDDELPWKEGSTLYNYLAGVSFRGLTGPIQFKEGRRVELKLDLLKLKAEKMQKVSQEPSHKNKKIFKFYKVMLHAAGGRMDICWRPEHHG